jgi:hypothetical protein
VLYGDTTPMNNTIETNKMDVLTLDGSYREGGGQILCTAPSLSAMAARPFRPCEHPGRSGSSWTDAAAPRSGKGGSGHLRSDRVGRSAWLG